MWVSASPSMAILMVMTWSSWIEQLVERTSPEEFSENFLRITEHERETTEDEVILERIVRVSSAMWISVMIVFIVS